MNILYIGPNDSEWAQMHRPVNLAAAKWSRGFLTGLSKVCKVTALTHTHERQWPKGRVFWRGFDARLYPPEWDCVAISYPCLRWIREWWWRFAYPRKAIQIIRARRIDAVVLYNCVEPHELAAMRAIKKTFRDAVKVFPIILDGDDPRKDDWGWLHRAALHSDGMIVLSWWIYKNSPLGLPLYHFDGGADGWRGVPPAGHRGRDVRTLVYAGVLDEWHGLDFLKEVVQQDKDPSHRYVLCGRDVGGNLARIFRHDSRVVVRGFVAETELNEICNSADVLLNIRNPKHPDNILNFPSKVPQYLSFGRPIVSVPLQSVSPAYESVIQFAVDDSVGAFVAKTREVLAWDFNRRRDEYQKIRGWFETNKKWDVLAQGLSLWLENQVRKMVDGNSDSSEASRELRQRKDCVAERS